MAKPDGVFVYVGTYPSEASARSRLRRREGPSRRRRCRHLRRGGGHQGPRWQGSCQQGRDDNPPRGLGGAAVGAVVGILFPPSIVATATVGAAVGGVSGHLWKGMSGRCEGARGRHRRGTAALVVVVKAPIEDALDKAELKAEKHAAKQLDVNAKDVDKAVQETAKQIS